MVKRSSGVRWPHHSTNFVSGSQNTAQRKLLKVFDIIYLFVFTSQDPMKDKAHLNSKIINLTKEPFINVWEG